jgi:hypothetical protein
VRVQGETHIGEAAAYSGRATARLMNARLPLFLTIAIVGAVIGATVGLSEAFAEPISTIVVLAVAIPLIGLALRIWRGFVVQNFRRNLMRRGMPNPVLTEYEVTPEAFICRSEGMEYRANWNVVTDLFKLGPYWVALAQAIPLVLPSRFFADGAAERAFVAAMLEHMEPSARDRSAQALEFTRFA